ncbi:Conserved_hypothetical protein [Hexamita inflata]|uniref:Uncharacterized protein n=1 Tax=Hexamita inflata TaxID=28002 RepID=A0AA86PJC9_9EUKA|nr:Conserved hypothetical protein [Hexamita inflata]
MQDTFVDELNQFHQYPQQIEQNGQILQITFPDETAMIPVSVDSQGNGLAIIDYADHSSYQGKINLNQPAEFGLYEAAGASILGSISNQLLSGPGAIRYSNGSIVKGHFHQNQLNAFGTAYEAQNNLYYAGDFRLSQPEGLGTMIQGDPQHLWLENECTNLYFGYFQNGVPHGRGVQFRADELRSQRFNRYEGYFSFGQRDGPGCLLLANGDQLIGQFRSGVKIGTFIYINEQGQLEFRFYENDLQKHQFQCSQYFVARANELKCVVIEIYEEKQFTQFIQAFKNERQTENQFKQLQETILRTCKKLTVPLKMGLVEDLRVCQPLMSEQIAEVARQATQQEIISEELIQEIESVKSAVINNYEIIKFVFDVYRARDQQLVNRKRNLEYPDELAELLAKFQTLTASNENNSPSLSYQQKSPQLDRQMSQQQLSYQNINAKSTEDRPAVDVELSNQDSMVIENTRGDTRSEEALNLHDNKSADMQIQNLEMSGIQVPQQQQLYESCQKFYDETQHLPKGCSSVDNNLIYTFFHALDNQYTISKQSVIAFYQDLANHLNKQDVLLYSETYLELLLNQYQKPSDSFSIINQFSINEPFCSSQYVFGFNQFLGLILQSFEIFNLNSAATFIQFIVNFAKGLMQHMQKIFVADQTLTQKVFTNPNEIGMFKPKIQDRDNDGVSVAGKSQAGKSIISNKTKIAKTSGQLQPAIPRVLVRDSSYQLSEIEQALVRMGNVDKKLTQIFKYNQKYERNLIHFKQVNEEIEAVITQYYGVSSTQYVHTEHLTALQYLEKVFNKLNTIFNIPKYQDDIQFYINALQPILVKYCGFDVFGYKQNVVKARADVSDADKQSKQFIMQEKIPCSIFYQLLCNVQMSPQLVQAILCCIIMQSPKLEQVEETQQQPNGEEEDDDMRNSVRSASIMSSANFGTRAEKEEDQTHEAVQQMFEVKKFDQLVVKQMAGDFLQQLVSEMSQ